MEEFEYKLLLIPENEGIAERETKRIEDRVATELNSCGDDGWELVTANTSYVSSSITMLFKRVIQ